MVPARLTLRNFLCYGANPPTLELEGIGLACLCGDNGHGKSALLDGITWALWGKARGKSLDGLIHHGQNDMEVDFEFLIGEARYRVVRKRWRAAGKGAGRSELEFQIRNGVAWQPLTGATVSETERSIESTLKLSYDTFINSALLLQGKADLFTAAGPSNRKAVLGEILGLARYDELEARAKDLRKERAATAAIHAGAIRDMEPVVARLPEQEREREQARAGLDRLAATLAARLAERDALALQQHALERQLADLREAEAARAAGRITVESGERRLAQIAAAIATDSSSAAVAPAIRAGYESLQSARLAERRWSEAASRNHELEATVQPLRAELARAEARLEHDVQSAKREQRELSDVVAQAAAQERELAALQSESSALAERANHLAGLRQQAAAQREEVAALEGENKSLRESAHAKRARLDDLKAAADRGERDCPLCRSALNEQDFQQVIAAWDAEGRAEAARFRANAEQIKTLKASAERLDDSAETMSREVETNQRRQDRQRATLEMGIEKGKAAAVKLREVGARADELAAALAGGLFAQEARQRVRALEQERDQLGYDAAAHRAATRRVDEFREYEQRQADLDRALDRLEANRADHTRQTEALTQARSALANAEARVQALSEATAASPAIAAKLADARAVAQGLEREQAALREKAGALDAAIANGRELERMISEKRALLIVSRRDEAAYDELARAFGKNGVQAFIIDAVLPELEREANRLLSGMTNGRMTVALETQRATRSGDAAETLLVRISDEWGTRDYEFYSGGEAFRINLSLRIALSKLLARRSGAPLPTLVIDEGFGSQDAAGRERLIEAITAIQQDFQCLLVVTHIDELKSAFDTRIEVTKERDGSVARVVMG